MFFLSLLDRLTNRNVPRRSSKSNRARQARRSAFRGSLRKDLRLEPLEPRQLLAYSFALTGSTATVTGDFGGVATDSLVIDQSGGWLRHSVNGGAFSDDWHDAGAGSQQLAADAGSTVTIFFSSGGGSSLALGTATAPASSLEALFELFPGGAGDTVLVDDSASTAMSTYTVDTGRNPFPVTGPGINVQEWNSASGGVTLKGGSAGNTFHVQSTWGSEPVTVYGGDGADRFVVGDTGNGVGDLDGSVTIHGGGSGADALNVNDSLHSSPRTLEVTSTTVGWDGGTQVTFDTVESLILDAGSGGDTINVRSSQAATPVTINADGGNDTVNIGNPLDEILGAVVVSGGEGAADRLNIDLTNVPTSALEMIPTVSGGVGGWQFGGTPWQVSFVEFETYDATGGLYDLWIMEALSEDWTLTSPPFNLPAGSGFGWDGVADTIGVQLDATGTVLEIVVAGVPQASAVVGDQITHGINGLEVVGSGDADVLTITETAGGLPSFPGDLTGGWWGHQNEAFLNSGRTNAFGSQDIDIHFEALGSGNSAGADTIVVDLMHGHDVAYFSDDVVAANSGVVNVQGEFNLSFSGVAPLILSGAGGPVTIDASSTPGTTWLDISDDPLDIAGPGGNVIAGDGGLETTYFAGFDSVYVYGGTGSETITLWGLDAASSETAITVDGDDSFGTDAADDWIRLGSLPATVNATLLGGGGNDNFENLTVIQNMDGILGNVLVDGQDGADRMAFSAQGSLGPAVTATLTDTQLSGAAGPGGAGGTFTYFNLTSLYFEATSFDDTMDIVSTAAGADYIINGDGGSDQYTIGNTAVGYSTPGTGSLDAILGHVTILADYHNAAGQDALNVDDSGTDSLASPGFAYLQNIGTQNVQLLNNYWDALTFEATQLGGFAPAPIDYAHLDIDYTTSGGNPLANRLEAFHVRASRGAEDIYVFDTTATDQTTLDARAGNDYVWLWGDHLSGNNLFQGFDGNDEFVLQINADIGSASVFPVASVQIEGNSVGGDSENRDRLSVADWSGAARTLTYGYLDSLAGDVDIAGFPNVGAVQVRTMETVIYFDNGENNDTITVRGTTFDEDLTVALRPNNTSAQVFLNGDPYTAAPGVASPGDSLAGNLPGVAGGSNGPDILINGIGGAGITLDGRPPWVTQELLVNGDFETGDFTGWTATSDIPLFYPQVVVGAGVTTGFGFFTTAPTSGAWVAFEGFDGAGPGTATIAQDVNIPPAATVALSFDCRAAWDMLNFGAATQDRLFQVEVQPFGGGAALQTFPVLTAQAGTANLDTGDLSFSVDLSAFVGQSVRVALTEFIPENYTGPGQLQIDNVSLLVTPLVPGIGNRAIIQAASEDDVVTGGANDIFNFGPGVLIQGFGAGNAFDDINVNNATSGADRVTVDNTVFGGLVPLTVVPASFVNYAPTPPRPGLIVNAGDEDGLRTTGHLAGIVADNIDVIAHPQFNIQVNGNLPTLSFGSDGLPVGDQLNLSSPTSFNIWSDKADPPNASIFAGNDVFGVFSSSIERTFLTPANGVLNLIGDQNNAAIDQHDNFVVVGRNVDVDGENLGDGGYQEMTVSINGSSPILVEGVQFLNAYGFDLQGVDRINPGIDPKPDGGDGGIDTLDVRPYADNTPRGWGVHVNYNEGVPAQTDGAQQDLLIYRTSLYGGAVSEGIVVQPAAADAGQVFANNTATGTPIVVVDYLANTDVLVIDDDGFASDTDTLTLRGTNPDPANALTGHDRIVADFTQDGDSANPVVEVWDSLGTPTTGDDLLLYRLRTNAVDGAAPLTFDTLNIETLGGNDSVSVIGRSDGSLTVNVDGGTGADVVVLPGAADGSDVFTVTPGADHQAGTAQVASTGSATISYTNLEDIQVNGQGGTGVDRLFVNGTGGANTFTLTAGALQTDIAPDILFQNFGSTAPPAGQFNLNLLGSGGEDSFSLDPQTALTVNADGGLPTDGDHAVVNGTTSATADTMTVTPTGAASAEVQVNTLGLVTVTTVASLSINGQGGGDALTLNGTASDDTTTIDAQQTGAGTFRSGLSPLVDFRSFATVTVNPGTGGFDRVVINGTEGPDEFTTPAADAVELTGGVRTILGSTGAVNLDRLEINALGGDDNVTLDADLTVTGLSKIVDAGDGNDRVDLAGITSAGWVTIFGGQGNDLLVGADIPVATQDPGDTIDGGLGNDQITGGVGNDWLFGGDGSDIFVWDQGDGSDLVEGDGGGVDVLIFNAATAAQLAVEGFTLSANTPATPAPNTAARLLLNRAQGDVKLDVAGVEQVDINGGSGVETFDVNDLTQTEVRVLNLNLGTAGNTESVTVNGRNLDDSLHVTLADAIVNVSGLRYDVNVAGAVAEPDDDRLTVSGHDGHDTLTIGDNVEGAIDVTLDGGAGDDRLIAGSGHTSTDTILNGGAGDDFLQGGSGDDHLNGGAGEDTFVGGIGDDAIDGGDGFDTILINGTSGRDYIDVAQPDGTTLRYAISGVIGVAPTETDTLVAGSVEEARVAAGAGADVIRVRHADGLVATPGLSLRMTVEGGAGNAEDRLGVVDDGDGDLVIQRQGADDQSGSISVGPLAPVVYEQVEFVQVVPLDPNTGGTGTDGLGRLLIFKHDPYESNDSRLNAYFLGSGATLNVDPKVDPGADGVFQNLPGDEDWYRFVAAYTGSLDFQVYFTQVGTLANSRAGLPGDGNLDIEVRDASGDLITGFGANDADNDERIRIPAVEGQTYYLRVRGATPDAINQYRVTIVNLAPPVPSDLELQDIPVGDPPPANSDTGRSQFDNVTRDNTPVVRFRLEDDILRQDIQGNDGTVYGNNPPDQQIPILIPGQDAGVTAGYRVAVFDEGTPQQPGTLPQVPVGFARRVAAGVYEFNFDADTTDPNYTLTDGSHFLSARVQIVDPSTPSQTGYGARSASLEIVVDTTPPPISFGLAGDPTDGLHPDSDTGILWQPESFDDNVTSDTTPTFWGIAEADAVIRLYVDVNANGTINPGVDFYIGETVAVPLDGTNQFPNGQWELTSVVDMNDWQLLDALGNKNGIADDPRDGVRHILAYAEDLAGNVSTPPQALDIFIDTQGPQITDVDINNLNNPYDLFDPKPSTDGPTPLVDRLVISIRDLPGRAANWLYAAIKTHPEAVVDWVGGVATEPRLLETGFFSVAGDANGLIPIYHVTFASDGDLTTAPANDALTAEKPATGYITIWFGEAGVDGLFGTADDIRHPLPDDRFTLTITDDIRDYAGNRLDGESNADEPHEAPTFPTGDDLPGGDFVARFTVDSRPEIGVYDAGSVWMDTNGNATFDPDNLDYTNRDIIYMLGYSTDTLFAGNFSAIGAGSVADGFDKLAAYGRVGNNFRWLIDTNNDGVPEDLDGDGQLGVKEPMGTTGMPVAGNFDNIAANGDEVGLLAGDKWYFDTNHDYKLDKVVTLSLTGLPIVGDFDGNGWDDLGTWKDDRFTFQMATGPGTWSNTVLTIDFGFIGVREIPVAADLDRDGIDDIGLWVPDRVGVAGVENGEWYLLVSDDRAGTRRVAGSVGTLNHPFRPIPFGKDMYASFGDDFALPLLGNFDPPAVGRNSSESGILLTNPDNRFDVNADGFVNALDVLLLVNDQNSNGSRQLTVGNLGGPYLDVNGDGWATPGDIVSTINHINGQSFVGGEGEGEAVADDGWTSATALPSAASPITAAAESLTSVQYAGLRAEPWPASSAGTGQSATEQVDQYFAGDAGRADDAWADLAKDQGRPEDEEADGFFAQLGQLLQRLV